MPAIPRRRHPLLRLLQSAGLTTAPSTITCNWAARARDLQGEGQVLAIIEQLAETPEPHFPPHGRFPIVQISKLRLEQEFRHHRRRGSRSRSGRQMGRIRPQRRPDGLRRRTQQLGPQRRFQTPPASSAHRTATVEVDDGRP